jgi:periplasmic divalent cation tolerance protein
VTDKIVMFSTTGTEEEALKIAHVLVNAHLAACVNIVPRITSVYRWQGNIEESAEFLLIIKTGRALTADVQAAIERAHSYDLPEAIAIPIVDGSVRYLEWLEAGLKREDSSSR